MSTLELPSFRDRTVTLWAIFIVRSVLGNIDQIDVDSVDVDSVQT